MAFVAWVVGEVVGNRILSLGPCDTFLELSLMSLVLSLLPLHAGTHFS